jgi:hypothetical protein
MAASPNFEVYPNPSNSQFNLVVYNTDETYSVLVHDITGRILEKREQVSPEKILQFGANFSSGIYIVEIVQGSERIVSRVVKND